MVIASSISMADPFSGLRQRVLRDSNPPTSVSRDRPPPYGAAQGGPPSQSDPTLPKVRTSTTGRHSNGYIPYQRLVDKETVENYWMTLGVHRPGDVSFVCRNKGESHDNQVSGRRARYDRPGQIGRGLNRVDTIAGVEQINTMLKQAAGVTWFPTSTVKKKVDLFSSEWKPYHAGNSHAPYKPWEDLLTDETCNLLTAWTVDGIVMSNGTRDELAAERVGAGADRTTSLQFNIVVQGLARINNGCHSHMRSGELLQTFDPRIRVRDVLYLVLYVGTGATGTDKSDGFLQYRAISSQRIDLALNKAWRRRRSPASSRLDDKVEYDQDRAMLLKTIAAWQIGSVFDARASAVPDAFAATGNAHSTAVQGFVNIKPLRLGDLRDRFGELVGSDVIAESVATQIPPHKKRLRVAYPNGPRKERRSLEGPVTTDASGTARLKADGTFGNQPADGPFKPAGIGAALAPAPTLAPTPAPALVGAPAAAPTSAPAPALGFAPVFAPTPVAAPAPASVSGSAPALAPVSAPVLAPAPTPTPTPILAAASAVPMSTAALQEKQSPALSQLHESDGLPSWSPAHSSLQRKRATRSSALPSPAPSDNWF